MMEMKPNQVLVRDLDLTLQPRTSPRYKVWLPLATQQLRLRNLCQIIGYNLETDKKFETCWFYFTLHRSSMSSPFYTSEPTDNISPRWASLEVPTLHATGLSTANEIVLRLWRRTEVDDPSTDVTIFTWGISFTGLVYMGPKLSNNLEPMLRNNSLIFHLHGGFFVPSYCLQHSPEFRRYLYMSVSNSDICQSYTVEQLIELQNQMKYMKEKSDNVQILRDKIATGGIEQLPKYKQTQLNKLLQPQKISKEKKFEILKIKKQLEIEKFRKKLLEQERIRKVSNLRKLNKLHLSMMEDNQDQGLLLMERYRELNKDVERLRKWRQNHIETREIYVQTSAQLAYRRRKLMADLTIIYPINQNTDNNNILKINNVHLPDSEELNLSKNDISISVGLGYVVQTIDIVAKILNIPTRYPMINYGSRCKIIDHITDNIPDKDRQFPLFSRNKDKLKFHYGVYLLNKNIAQLRWYCGLPTADLRCTLSNLSTLLNLKASQTLDNTKRTLSGSSLDTDISNNFKHNELPLTPPLQKLLFDKMNLTDRTMYEFKNTKKILSSSLDQGLDKPIFSNKFDSKLKRIYKSEECAIDNKTLSLPRDRISNSSDENINIRIFCKNKNINKTSNDKLNKSLTSSSSSEILDTEIEISIPLSIVKINSDNSSIRQTSSTSISSCEMALNSSQNDVVDNLNFEIINDNKKINNKKIDEESSGGSPSTISIIDKTDCNISQETLKNDNFINEKIITNNSDTLSHSFINISDSIDKVDNQHVVASSCPESAKSFYDDCDDNNLPINCWKYDLTTSLQTTSHGVIDNNCEKIQTATLSQLQPNKADQVFNNFQASTELIDSMRRSSENVYARTEALASKKTSFKVMKPRF